MISVMTPTGPVKVGDLVRVLADGPLCADIKKGDVYAVAQLVPPGTIGLRDDVRGVTWSVHSEHVEPASVFAGQVIKSESIRPFDVDDTIILHGDKGHAEYKTVEVPDRVEGKTLTFRIHEPMVRLLKEEHARGSYIIVWSRSGYQWAHDVVKALGLEDKVHLIMSKPMVYFDDSPVENWMKDRVYLSPDAHYKK
jgi:hypothetical protein